MCNYSLVLSLVALCPQSCMDGVYHSRANFVPRVCIRWLPACVQESIGINQSLFVLRNVIKALASGLREDEGASHFRDSKLTSLLKVGVATQHGLAEWRAFSTSHARMLHPSSFIPSAPPPPTLRTP